MNLSNFEEYIDQVILDRGKKYYGQGNIFRIQEVNEDYYIFQVSGYSNYTVHIFTSK